MQRISNFTPQEPKIGIDRNLFSNIKINSFNNIDESEKFDDSQIDSVYIDNMLNKNFNNINKYKNEGVYCIYDEKNFETEKITLINYQNLMEILAYDETAFDNFIEKGKGNWIQNISEALNSITKKISEDNKNDKNPDENLNLNEINSNLNFSKNKDIKYIDINLNKKCNDIISDNLFDVNKVNSNNNNKFNLKNSENDNIEMINIKKTRKDLIESQNQNLVIEFESRFESGNLRMANQLSENEYDLILKNDINAGKTSTWFFFRVNIKNMKKIDFLENPQMIKFNIINCQKIDTLFRKGLKVLYYSESQKKWFRNTKNNYYYCNNLTIEEKRFHTLTFSLELNKNFKTMKNNNNDLINTDENKTKQSKDKSKTDILIEGEDSISEENFYFAYCFPYTFDYLQKFLSKILNNQKIIQKNILRHEIIGKSLAGNNLDMLIITNFDSQLDEIAYRPCIILTSRVHPGESNSSFVIQGVIEFLLETKNPTSEVLRKNFIFKIVPMLNPDGVINGNFRASLIGKDLNRLWDDPRENICPTIFYTKEMIKKTLLSRDIFLFCDFHGHSNKPNFFLYGCPSNRKIKLFSTYNNQEIILSKMFSCKNDIFDHKSCTYKIVAKKLKTARAVLKNEFNIDLSYCLESSIGYISIGDRKLDFFTPQIYEKIGRDFCHSIFELQDKNIYSEMISKLQIEELNKGFTLNNSLGSNKNRNHKELERIM